MAKVDIKGNHRVSRPSASGKVIEYHYAWRGGPRFWRSGMSIAVNGPDYFSAYRQALEGRNPSKGLFREVMAAYLDAPKSAPSPTAGATSSNPGRPITCSPTLAPSWRGRWTRASLAITTYATLPRYTPPTAAS